MNTQLKLTPEALQRLKNALPTMPDKQKRRTLELLQQYQSEVIKEVGKTDFLSFIKHVYPGYMVGPHHEKLAKIFEDTANGRNKRTTISIAPRHGKLLADDTPVLTTRGWKQHGNLQVGDEVFHPSGHPVQVVAVSASAAADMRVEFFDGSVFYCHGAHEWTMFSMVRRQWETFETQRFLKPNPRNPAALKQVLSDGRALHHLPLVAPLQFPEADLLVHPYVLGAWLGDGSAGKPCVTHSKDDQPYVDRIAQLGYPVSSVCTHATTGVITTYFSGPKPNNAGRLTRELQTLGIYRNKKIPEQYLRGSVQQRLDLLAGLMDTDGSVDKNSRCAFTSCNRALVEGVIELVRSFGWRSCEMEYQPRLSSSGIQGKKVYWAVSFQPTFIIPTALQRKQILRFQEQRRIGLKSVTLDPQGKIGRCIQIASEDGLYLVGRTLVPTHNSEMISYLAPAWYLGKFPQKKIIMASHTADLAVNFGRRVRNLVDSDAYRDIFPQVKLQADSKSASRWGTNFNGEYFAIGVGGALAGRGADLFIIDDPHALEKNTEIPTPQGFKTIAQLQVGEEVFGPDGVPAKILAKSEVWKDRELYQLTTDDGEQVLCDGGHLWSYHSETSLKNAHLIKTATTRELSGWNKDNRPCLPRYTPTDKRRRSFKIETTTLRGDVQCITVDRPDGLFLVGRGYIVTHNSEQDAMQGRAEVFDPAWEWFQAGPLQRLMPGGSIIVVATRWSKADLIGRITEHFTKNEDAGDWEIVEFPAIMETAAGEQKSLWPEFWPLEDLLQKKANMDVRYWQSQYLQNPTSEEGALLKREWWQIWEKDDPPMCQYIIMSLDAAQETHNRADYNALQVWGVFFNETVNNNQIILLNSIRQRMEFPDLKELVLNEYNEWKPDSFIVEKKSNGSALYQEIRRMGLPVGEFTPGKGQDKISRVNAVSDLFKSGIVWAPDRRWAREVIEEANDFPAGRNDDMVDAMTLALMRFRQGGFLRLPSDEPEPRRVFKGYRREAYY